MRTLLLAGSLAAVFSGPFLREAEGAADLIRSLSELSGASLLEEIDGGVGDDPETAVLSSRPDLPADDTDSAILPLLALDPPEPRSAWPGMVLSHLGARLPHRGSCSPSRARLAFVPSFLC